MLVPSITISNGKAISRSSDGTLVMQPMESLLPGLKRWQMFSEIAVFDQDAALGQGDNLAWIIQLCQSGACRVGGGVRNPERLYALLNAGAAKILFESATPEHLLRKAPKQQSLVELHVGTQARSTTASDPVTAILSHAKRFSPLCSGFLITGVTQSLSRQVGTWFPAFKTATGLGLTFNEKAQERRELLLLDQLGVDVQMDISLCQKDFEPLTLFLSCLRWQDNEGLLPTIAQDENGQVCMMAWQSRETLSRALMEKKGIYWSRAQSEGWECGHLGGQPQTLLRVETTEARNTLQMRVALPNAARASTPSSLLPQNHDALKKVLGHAFSMESALTSPHSSMSHLRQAVIRLEVAQTTESLAQESALLFHGMVQLLKSRGMTLEQLLNALESHPV